MTRTLFALCLFAALCGCAKRSRPTAEENPLNVFFGGAKSNAPAPQAGAPQAPALLRPALPAGWTEFKHPDGAYTAFFPAPPSPCKSILGFGDESLNGNLNQPVPANQTITSTYQCVAYPLSMVVAVVVYSPEQEGDVRAAVRTRASEMKKVWAPTTWAGRPAYELVLLSDDGKGKFIDRHLWIGNRLYFVSLFGFAPGRPTAAEAAAVFDSFTLGK